ncbi:hypothetical protein D3C81_1869850 [compost metagenome]
MVHTLASPFWGQGHLPHQLAGPDPGDILHTARFIKIQNQIITLQQLARRFPCQHHAPGCGERSFAADPVALLLLRQSFIHQAVAYEPCQKAA